MPVHNLPPYNPDFADSTIAASPVSIFISYRHVDHRVLDELRDHLGWLESSDQIRVFDDREILAGDDWAAHIKTELERAGIIVLISHRQVHALALLHKGRVEGRA